MRKSALALRQFHSTSRNFHTIVKMPDKSFNSIRMNGGGKQRVRPGVCGQAFQDFEMALFCGNPKHAVSGATRLVQGIDEKQLD
jgi:hypothetical protein